MDVLYLILRALQHLFLELYFKLVSIMLVVKTDHKWYKFHICKYNLMAFEMAGTTYLFNTMSDFLKSC